MINDVSVEILPEDPVKESKISIDMRAWPDEVEPDSVIFSLELLFQSEYVNACCKNIIPVKLRKVSLDDLTFEERHVIDSALYDQCRVIIATLAGHAGLPMLLLPELGQVKDATEMGPDQSKDVDRGLFDR